MNYLKVSWDVVCERFRVCEVSWRKQCVGRTHMPGNFEIKFSTGRKKILHSAALWMEKISELVVTQLLTKEVLLFTSRNGLTNPQKSKRSGLRSYMVGLTALLPISFQVRHLAVCWAGILICLSALAIIKVLLVSSPIPSLDLSLASSRSM